MKYLKVIFMICLLMLSACKKEEIIEETETNEEDVFSLLSSLPDDPKENDEIFIIANDAIRNEEVWTGFYEKAVNEEDCQIIIALYTIEGDVIYELLKAQDGLFHLYIDYSRDHFYANVPHVEISRSFLYYYEYESTEEVNGEPVTFKNRFCFLSDRVCANDKDFLEAFEDWRLGKENGFDVVWLYAGRME